MFPSFSHHKTRFEQQKHPGGCFLSSVNRFKHNPGNTVQSKGGKRCQNSKLRVVDYLVAIVVTVDLISSQSFFFAQLVKRKIEATNRRF